MEPLVEALVSGASDDHLLDLIAEKEAQEVGCEEEREEVSEKKPAYKSVIKVRGRRILPPVMTEAVRSECQQWRMRAVQVEQRLAEAAREKTSVSEADKTNEAPKERTTDSISETCGNTASEESGGSQDSSCSELDHLEDAGLTEEEEEGDDVIQRMRTNSRLAADVLHGERRADCGDHKRELTAQEEIVPNDLTSVTECNQQPPTESNDHSELSHRLEAGESVDQTRGHLAMVETPGPYSLQKYQQQPSHSPAASLSPKQSSLSPRDLSVSSAELSESVTDFSVSLVPSHTSAPKSFEEIKKLVRAHNTAPSKSRSSTPHQVSSDISDDETSAPSIHTEVYSETERRSSDFYNHTQYLENNRAPGLYDSMLSVNTVIENPSYGANTRRKNSEVKERQEVGEVEEFGRPRRGSYSLTKPSPILQAHMNRFGGEEDMSHVQRGAASIDQKQAHKLSAMEAAHKTANDQVTTSRAEVCRTRGDGGPHSTVPQGSLQYNIVHSRPLDQPRGREAQESPVEGEHIGGKSSHGGLMELLTAEVTGEGPTTADNKRQLLAHYLENISPSLPAPESPKKYKLPQDLSTSSSFNTTASKAPAGDHTRPSPASKVKRHLSLDNPRSPPLDKNNSPFIASRTLSRSPNLSQAAVPHLELGSLADTHSGKERSKRKNTKDKAKEEKRVEAEDEPAATSSSMSLPNGGSTYRTSSSTLAPASSITSSSTPAPEDLQQVVSSLALAQQASLQELLLRQEEERRSLREEFEKRQKQLVQEILSQFPGLQVEGVAGGGKENIPPRNAVLLSPTSSSSGTLKEEPLRPVLRSNTFKVMQGSKEQQQLPPVKLPAAALGPLHLQAWVRLTALARGYLTRRLMATEKVRHLKTTIRETLTCAIDLHREAMPRRQEIDFHARLLAQLEAACGNFHHVLFGLTVAQRMAIIASDRDAKRVRSQRSPREVSSPQRKISAATASRLASKSSGDRSSSSPWESRRRKVVLSSRAGLRAVQARPVRSIISASNTEGSLRGTGGRHAFNGDSRTGLHGESTTTMIRSLSSLRTKKPSWK